MKTVKINLYSFNELETAAKEKAISEHKSFLDSLLIDFDDEDENGEYISKSEYFDHEENDVIENILANDYIFFQNGDLAETVSYIGTHPKTGKTEFKFKGETFSI